MRHRTIVTTAASALAAFALAGCGVFAPEDPGGAASSATSAATFDAEEHATGLEHATEPPTDAEERPTDLGISEDQALAEVADGVIVPDEVDLSTVYGDRPLTQHEVDTLSPSFELHAICTDDETLAANAGHDPVGWPADHQRGEPLPNPQCHPDFIEVHEWELFDVFHACCEGAQTSTAVTQRSWDEQREFEVLWGQSRARANWSPAEDDRVDDW